MGDLYTAWIEQYVARGSTFGRCREAVVEMRETFPELTEVRGHVHSAWGKRGHAWLTDADGTIVDPTRGQFPGPIEYEPWEPGDEVRVGKCMNCGDEIWRAVQTLSVEPKRECACSTECEAELMREFA